MRTRYDANLVVIGAGSAGLVSAYVAAAVRSKVVLIERDRMGGDCLNTGCVPSKTLIRSARFLADARRAERLGLRKVEVEFDFRDVMARVRRVIRTIEPHDSVERYTALGVECLGGDARITSPHTVEVAGRRISSRAIVVATGGRPLVPPIPGLDAAGHLTSDTVWDLDELPRRLVVLGGGPIGCELAQAFARFGSEVRVVEMLPRILPREDPDIAAFVERRFRAEGISLSTGRRATRVTAQDGRKRLFVEHEGGTESFEFDHLLVALGRGASVEGLGLEKVGVAMTPAGTVAVDERLRTACPSIYACGDVVGPYQFTHVAAHQAWYAATNALFAPLKRSRVDYSVIPWATFTDPEVAQVGLNETAARAAGVDYEVTTYDIAELDRAIAEENAEGVVKVLTVPGKDRILGASIVGPQAGDLIIEYITAMRHGLGLNKILGTIHVYPTLVEANRFAAGAWRRAHAPPAALRMLERFHRWRL